MKQSFEQKMEDSLNSYFPKYKSKERSSALMLFSYALTAYREELEKSQRHIGYLLGSPKPNDQEYIEAKAHYLERKG